MLVYDHVGRDVHGPLRTHGYRLVVYKGA